VWPRRAQSAMGLVLAVLVMGTAGSDGVRVCPHHGGDMGHGYVHLSEGGSQDAPVHDPGPCDHDLGVCETVAPEPNHSAAQAAVSLDAEVVGDFGVLETELIRAPEPTFLIPFSTGPPSFLA